MSLEGTLYRRRSTRPLGELFKVSRLDPTIGFFWCLMLLHVVVWTILATATQPNLPAQTLEMLSSGREFQWGYATQPPLGVWLASLVSRIAGTSNWPVYFLSQLCGAVSVWAAWRLARKFLHPWTALCAAFVLLGGYSCTIAASAFSGDQLAGAFWSLSIYTFYLALTHDRRRYWAATGLCLALGFLSSYGTFLLLLTMFIFTLVNDRARQCWDSSWPFLAGMAMLALLMPHLLWLVQHQFLTVQAGIERSASFTHHLVQPLSFLGTQLLCVIPVIILLTPLVAWFSFEEPARTEDEDRDFARQYLLWLTCLPPAIIFGLSLMAGPSSAIFAGVTNWSFLGVVVLMWGHLSETRLSWRRSIIRIGTAVGMFAAALIALNVMMPQIQRQGATTQFPGAELSRKIESIWANFGYQSKTPIVAGPSELVRHAAWYAKKGSVKSYTDLNPAKNPEVNDQTLIRDGGVIVWNLDDHDVPSAAELRARFGNVSFVNPVDLKWQSDAGFPSVRVGMAVVHPASAEVASRPANSSFVTSDGTVIPAISNGVIAAPGVNSFTPTMANPTPQPLSSGSSASISGGVNLGNSVPLPSNYPAATYSMPESSIPAQFGAGQEPTPTPATRTSPSVPAAAPAMARPVYESDIFATPEPSSGSNSRSEYTEQ